MAYLYRHIRLDKNVPFYVGIGDDKEGLYKRAFTQYTKDMVFIREWECAKYAIKYYSMNKTAITDCLRGRQKTAKGYIWTKNIIQNA